MSRFWAILITTLLFVSSSQAGEKPSLSNFIIKENLLKNDKIAVIAASEDEKPIELNGRYLFTINGFKQELNFNEGVAITPQAIEKSTFIYLKHETDSNQVNKLYYVYKSSDALNPIKINLKFLVLIPLIVISIIALFRKFLVYGLLILAGLIYFNISKGLSLPTYFETIFDGLKSFF